MQTAVLSAHSLDGPEGMEWQVRQGGMAVMACPELRVLQEVSQSERDTTITFCRPVSGHTACYVVLHPLQPFRRHFGVGSLRKLVADTWALV